MKKLYSYKKDSTTQNTICLQNETDTLATMDKQSTHVSHHYTHLTSFCRQDLKVAKLKWLTQPVLQQPPLPVLLYTPQDCFHSNQEKGKKTYCFHMEKIRSHNCVHVKHAELTWKCCWKLCFVGTFHCRHKIISSIKIHPLPIKNFPSYPRCIIFGESIGSY